MDVAGFIEWTRSVEDEEKPELASRAASARVNVDEQFLGQARAAAEAVISDPDFGEHRIAVAASATPENWDEIGLDQWNRDVGNALRGAYEDALLAICAGTAIRREYRRVLAGPLLGEVDRLREMLRLSDFG